MGEDETVGINVLPSRDNSMENNKISLSIRRNPFPDNYSLSVAAPLTSFSTPLSTYDRDGRFDSRVGQIGQIWDFFRSDFSTKI